MSGLPRFRRDYPMRLFASKHRLLITCLAIICLADPAAILAGEAQPTSEITLGMSTALSGPSAYLGQSMRNGVLAGLERANRDGGIHGARLRLICLDDGYEPARSGPNMRRLLQQDHVLAVIGNVGTPTAIVSIPIANEQHTLFFAPLTGSDVCRKSPPDRYVINYRASYAEETGAMIDALLDRGGLQPEDIAFFTQRDGYGDSGFDGGIAALKRHGLKDDSHIVHVYYERNTLAVENALANLLYAERHPKAIVMVGTYGPCGKFIKLAHESGLKALFLNVSFVGGVPLAAAIGDLPIDVVVTQVVPHPCNDSLPIVREFRTDLHAVAPSATPAFGALEGYVAARIFVSGLNQLSGPITRESVVNALNNMGEFDLGIGQKLHFSPNEHQASHHVWATKLQGGQFIPFDWSEIGQLLKKEPTR